MKRCKSNIIYRRHVFYLYILTAFGSEKWPDKARRDVLAPSYSLKYDVFSPNLGQVMMIKYLSGLCVQSSIVLASTSQCRGDERPEHGGDYEDSGITRRHDDCHRAERRQDRSRDCSLTRPTVRRAKADGVFAAGRPTVVPSPSSTRPRPRGTRKKTDRRMAPRSATGSWIAGRSSTVCGSPVDAQRQAAETGVGEGVDSPGRQGRGASNERLL